MEVCNETICVCGCVFVFQDNVGIQGVIEYKALEHNILMMELFHEITHV